MDYSALADAVERDGFAVVRQLLSPEVVEGYRRECEHQFKAAPRLEGKVYVAGETPDYVQPWMVNEQMHTVASHRLYQFYHNPRSSNAQHIIDTLIALRDRIEERWPRIKEFNEKNRFTDYNIVAKYAPTGGFQSRHSDMDSSLPHPALQCEMYLTQPGVDYSGGDLRLYPSDGRIISTNDDLQLRVGDAIFFDKRLDHDVTATQPIAGGRGRWMALIGAKTFPRGRRTWWQDSKIKVWRFFFLRTPRLYRAIKRFRGAGAASLNRYTA